MSTAKKTISDIKNAKGAAQPLVCLTAYTDPLATLLDPHCDLILVGDSLGMVLYGLPSTENVTLDMMIAHGKAVTCKPRQAVIIVDMPCGSYEAHKELALRNARRIMDTTGCDGVKLEGGKNMAATIAHLVENNIPVMGHIGLMPQSANKEGGYMVKGKTDEEIKRLLEDAKAIEDAGAFSFVIEATIEDVARTITQSVSIPTIGIGASAACDGQVLVTEDMLGMLTGHTPKFVKKYADLAEEISCAVESYANEVRSRKFPSGEYLYGMKK
ncbi:MAG: 3-methyl-2-oxobutanoate hydroxymethyltransferase [Alphaproteobacteria bacterium]|nr:3-methyl-2-oxobutanoate hydroxymethyltransferase [Alphaproteobacteria bacterium]